MLRFLVFGLWLASAPAALGHVVLSRASLRQYVQHSDACIHAAFETGPEVFEGGGDRQEFFRVEVLAPLFGPFEAGQRVEFFPHAEGMPDFARGDRAVVCLERTSERTGFERHTERFAWFTEQGPGDEWHVEGGTTLSLARGWRAWVEGGGQDAEGLVDLIATGLASGNARLQGDALGELAGARTIRGVLDDPGHVARLAAFVADPGLSIGRRARVRQILEGAPGFDDAKHTEALLRAATAPADRIVLARALASSALPGLAEWYDALSRDADPGVRRAAVRAQASRGARSDRALLVRASADPDEGVARAAIVALGALGDAAAGVRLSELANGDDPQRARWAAAELRRLRAREGASLPDEVP